MGRPMSAANQRFQCIPRKFKGCIYVAELANGVIKVGYSRNPRTRMTSLAKQVARKLSTSIARFHISGDMALQQARITEAKLIASVGQIGTALDGTKEFFRGVCFADAVRLADLTAKA